MASAARLLVAVLALLVFNPTFAQLELEEDVQQYYRARQADLGGRICGFHFVSSSLEQVGGIRLRGGAVWTPIYVVRQQQVSSGGIEHLLGRIAEIRDAIRASEEDGRQAQADDASQGVAQAGWMAGAAAEEAAAAAETAAAEMEGARELAVRVTIARNVAEDSEAAVEEEQLRGAQEDWQRRQQGLRSVLRLRVLGGSRMGLEDESGLWDSDGSRSENDALWEARARALHAMHEELIKASPPDGFEVHNEAAEDVTAPQVEGQVVLPPPGASSWPRNGEASDATAAFAPLGWPSLPELLAPALAGVSLALGAALLFTCAVAAVHALQVARDESIILVTAPEYSSPLLQVYEESAGERQENPVYKEEMVSAYEPPRVVSSP